MRSVEEEKKSGEGMKKKKDMELPGFEPGTSGMQNKRSATEL